MCSRTASLKTELFAWSYSHD